MIKKKNNIFSKDNKNMINYMKKINKKINKFKR